VNLRGAETRTKDDLLEGRKIVFGKDGGVKDGLELLRGNVENGAHVSLEAGQHLFRVEHGRRNNRHRGVGNSGHDYTQGEGREQHETPNGRRRTRSVPACRP
jgi:hypothetical protein